ncbi:hypothetical protein NPIL_233671 [Nephila pilipes]|uniref:Uncharacterized protein n=1 Tax=Nephila pilipes TaxID=299642 RepID=A0A8X6PQH4_NEPPI|nr:hypothetical protein NPIL_233671 [Nephila pilipes]
MRTFNKYPPDQSTWMSLPVKKYGSRSCEYPVKASRDSNWNLSPAHIFPANHFTPTEEGKNARQHNRLRFPALYLPSRLRLSAAQMYG